MKPANRYIDFMENCLLYFSSIEIAGYKVEEIDPKFEKEFQFITKEHFMIIPQWMEPN